MSKIVLLTKNPCSVVKKYVISPQHSTALRTLALSAKADGKKFNEIVHDISKHNNQANCDLGLQMRLVDYRTVVQNNDHEKIRQGAPYRVHYRLRNDMYFVEDSRILDISQISYDVSDFHCYMCLLENDDTKEIDLMLYMIESNHTLNDLLTIGSKSPTIDPNACQIKRGPSGVNCGAHGIIDSWCTYCYGTMEENHSFRAQSMSDLVPTYIFTSQGHKMFLGQTQCKVLIVPNILKPSTEFTVMEDAHKYIDMYSTTYRNVTKLKKKSIELQQKLIETIDELPKATVVHDDSCTLVKNFIAKNPDMAVWFPELNDSNQ